MINRNYFVQGPKAIFKADRQISYLPFQAVPLSNHRALRSTRCKAFMALQEISVSVVQRTLCTCRVRVVLLRLVFFGMQGCPFVQICRLVFKVSRRTFSCRCFGVCQLPQLHRTSVVYWNKIISVRARKKHPPPQRVSPVYMEVRGPLIITRNDMQQVTQNNQNDPEQLQTSR